MFIYLETRWYAVPDLFDIDTIDEEQQCRFLNAELSTVSVVSSFCMSVTKICINLGMVKSSN